MNGQLLRQILLFCLLVSGALLLGALLAYPLYLLLPGIPFGSLAGRSSLIAGLLASLLYVRWTMPLTLAAIGYSRPANGWWRALAQGFVAGIVIMAMLATTLVLLGLSAIDDEASFTPAFFALALLKGLMAGIGASLVEETLFRGALFSALYARINLLWAILLSSLLYAAVHFLDYPEPAGAIHWYTGLVLFPQALAQLASPVILDHFMTLFLLGVLLALIRWRDGHIWRAFGLHAGIVMTMKLHSYTTDRVADHSLDWLLNDYSSRLGWLSAACMLVSLIVYTVYCHRRSAP